MITQNIVNLIKTANWYMCEDHIKDNFELVDYVDDENFDINDPTTNTFYSFRDNSLEFISDEYTEKQYFYNSGHKNIILIKVLESDKTYWYVNSNDVRTAHYPFIEQTILENSEMDKEELYYIIKAKVAPGSPAPDLSKIA